MQAFRTQKDKVEKNCSKILNYLTISSQFYYICDTLEKSSQKRLFLGKKCESSSAGRARPCQGRGRGFESRLSLQEAFNRGPFFRSFKKLL